MAHSRPSYLRDMGFALFVAFALFAFVGPALAQDNVWTMIGPYGARVSDIAVHPSNPQIVYMSASTGVIFKSADGGVTWTLTNSIQSSAVTRALTVHPTNPRIVYFAVGISDKNKGLYRSADGGDSWTRIWTSSGEKPSSIQAIAIDPLNPETVYLGTQGPIQPSREARLLRSADGGRTWTPSDAGLPDERQSVSRIVIAPSNPRTLYLVANRGREYPNGSYDTNQVVYRSANGGASWAPSGAGLPGPIRPGASLFIHALAVDPTNPQTVYAGTIRGVYRSTDGGASWTEFSAGLETQNGYLPSVGHLILDPANQTVYAAVSGESVYAIRVPDMGGSALRMDFDGSGDVGLDDFFLFAEAYGKQAAGASAKFDLDHDGKVGLNDFFLFADRFGQRAR